VSSPLYAATCVARHGAIVDIELEPTTAIVPHFPLSTFFAFALLHESGGALANEIDWDAVHDHSCRESPDRRVLTTRYIRDAGYVSTRDWTPATVSINGVYRNAVSERASRSTMDKLVALVRSGRMPAATFRIQTAEARWCAHLEAGMLWDVYAFDEEAGFFA
jgi:hypothetical protein